MKNIFLYITITIVFFTGCAKDTTSDSGTDIKVTTEDGKITLGNLDKSFYSISSADYFTSRDIGKYMEYDILTDYVVGLTSLKSDPLQKEYTYAYTGIYNRCDMTRAGVLDEDLFSVSVNDISLTKTKTRSGQTQADLQSLYGSNVKFNIKKKESTTRSGELENTTVDLYVPNLIHITSPEIKTEEDLYPLCYYKNFILKWNKDSSNENGILLCIEWLGTCCYGDSNPDAYIRRTDCLPDTGELVIDPAIFEGIPDTALCYLTILRGSVENVLIDDYSYKVVGETHEVLPFILIREIKQAS